MNTETSNARGEVEYEYEVWQGDALQAGGNTTDYASAKSEADHYALMYGQGGLVEVRVYEKRLLAAAPPPAAARGDVRGLVGELRKLCSWKHLMSYNEAYFGEPEGELKSVVYAIERNLPSLAAEGEICETDLRGAAVTQAGEVDQQPEARVVVDAALESLIDESGGHWSEDVFHIEGPDLLRLLRDTIALTGERNG